MVRRFNTAANPWPAAVMIDGAIHNFTFGAFRRSNALASSWPPKIEKLTPSSFAWEGCDPSSGLPSWQSAYVDMQCEVVATSNTVAAVAMPASTKNLRSKTLGFVSFAGTKDIVG